jgi:hypothetical protein
LSSSKSCIFKKAIFQEGVMAAECLRIDSRTYETALMNEMMFFCFVYQLKQTKVVNRLLTQHGYTQHITHFFQNGFFKNAAAPLTLYFFEEKFKLR